MTPIVFAPPRDRISLETDDANVVALAERLWDRASGGGPRGIRVHVRVVSGPAPAPHAERGIAWVHGVDVFSLSMGALLRVRIALDDATVEAEASEALLHEAPALASRYLLEAPVAPLFTRRGFTVLHAGAVVGAHGAVVVRGGPGAGKSTLVAAAWKAGLGVLADESLFVAREDADDLAAAVRDLTLRPDAVRLLALEHETAPAFSGGEEKRRVDLFTGARSAARRARRVATLLLGPRSPGPARLVVLEPEAFAEEFRRGEIPQERLGVPDAVARSWAAARSWRLDGAEDLAGAVAILRSLAGTGLPPSAPRRADHVVVA